MALLTVISILPKYLANDIVKNILIWYFDANRLLLQASKQGELQEIEYLCENGDIDVKTIDDALLLAANHNHLDCVKYLQERCSTSHAITSAFNCAIIKNHSSVIDYLFRFVTVGPYLIHRGLYNAVFEGHLSAVKQLIEYDLDDISFLFSEALNIIQQMNQSTLDQALIYAAAKGHLDTVEYLINQGANIHYHDDKSIRQAANNGHLNIVKHILKRCNHKINIDAVAHKAMKNAHIHVIKYLVEHGADTTVLENRLREISNKLNICCLTHKQHVYNHLQSIRSPMNLRELSDNYLNTIEYLSQLHVQNTNLEVSAIPNRRRRQRELSIDESE